MTGYPIACGETAIRKLDEALAAGPKLEHEDLVVAIRCVAELRNELVARWRQGEAPREMLDRANALLSLAYGAQAPLIGIHLHRIEQTRDGLKRLLHSVDAT
jgi:hypothetical protein